MTKLLFLAFMAIAVAFGEAATLTVGGTTGWAIPPTTDFYNDWAANQTFVVGDTLEFRFVQGSHAVARVTETDYGSCNLDSPIFTQTTSPFSFVINDTSAYYFVCTFGNHCSRGQKLAITDVQAASTPPPSTANGPTSPAPPPPPSAVSGPTTSTTPSPPPPQSNYAHSLASAFSLAVIAIAVAFLG